LARSPKDRQPRPGRSPRPAPRADVFETSSHRIEALYRERLLEDFHTPALRDIVAEAFPRGTGSTSPTASLSS